MWWLTANFFSDKGNANQAVTLTVVRKKSEATRGSKGRSIFKKILMTFLFLNCLEKKWLHLYKPTLCWQLQNCGINCLLLYSQLSSGVSHGLSMLSTANCNVQLKTKNTFKHRNNSMGDGIGWNKDTSVCLVETLLQNLCILCHNIERSVVVRWILLTVH